jgi:hypothetical protein
MGVYIPKMLRLLKVNSQEIEVGGDDGVHDRDGDNGDSDGYKSIRARHDTSFFDEVSHLL